MKNKITKRLLAIAMAVTVAVTAVPLTVEAAPVYNKSQVMYINDGIYESFQIECLKKSQTIIKSSVKSDNKAVAEPMSLIRQEAKVSYKSEYYEGVSASGSSSSNSYSNYIVFRLKKPGTATISFKIKGIKATQKAKITVKKYVNPVKSLKISGVSGDLKEKTAKGGMVSQAAKLNKTVKNATVKIASAKGWKVQSIYVYDGDNQATDAMCGWEENKNSATLKVGSLKKNHRYHIVAAFVNTSNNGIIHCHYWIN